MWSFIAAFVLICFALGANCGETRIVETNNGLVRGTAETTFLNNVHFFAFRGIPYAKPPIGDLRLKVWLLSGIRCKRPKKSDDKSRILGSSLTRTSNLTGYRHRSQLTHGSQMCWMPSIIATFAFNQPIFGETRIHKAKTACTWTSSCRVSGHAHIGQWVKEVFIGQACNNYDIKRSFRHQTVSRPQTKRQTCGAVLHPWRRLRRRQWQWFHIRARYVGGKGCGAGNIQLSPWCAWLFLAGSARVFRQYGHEGSAACVEVDSREYRAFRRRQRSNHHFRAECR